MSFSPSSVVAPGAIELLAVLRPLAHVSRKLITKLTRVRSYSRHLLHTLQQ